MKWLTWLEAACTIKLCGDLLMNGLGVEAVNGVEENTGSEVMGLNP